MSILKPLLVSVLIFIVFLEVGLRFTGMFRTYSEMIGLGYVTYYGQTDEDHYHTWLPNQQIVYDQPEFNFSFKANALGLREKPFEQKKDSVFRIFCIGDSFTEGDGAAYEDSYPRCLERKLNANSDSVQYEVLNAGVCGSDIFFMNKILEDQLLVFKPDAVIYMLNSSDISDVIFRGGSERFLPDGTSKFRPAPWFHIAYRFSFIVRMICELGLEIDNSTMLSQEQLFLEQQKALKLIGAEFKRGQKICNQHGVKTAIVVQPSPTSYFGEAIKRLGALEKENALTPEELKIGLPSSCDMINVCGFPNTLRSFVSAYSGIEHQEYAWSVNGHFNAKGYNILSNIVHQEVLKEDPLFFVRQ